MAETIELKSLGCPVKFEFYRENQKYPCLEEKRGNADFHDGHDWL